MVKKMPADLLMHTEGSAENWEAVEPSRIINAKGKQDIFVPAGTNSNAVKSPNKK